MKCVHMACHQCDDAQVAELKAALVTARGELIAALAEEKAAVEAADRLTEERDDARAEVERLSSGEAEWAARRCECGADDACAFARERDEAQVALSEADRNVDRLIDSLATIEKAILEALPYRHSDGEAADPAECIGYAAEELAQLRQERDGARAEVERLKAVLAATEADVADFMAVLQWYFENDETQEGGTWEIYNAASLRVKREAKRLLELPVRSYVKDKKNG